MNGQLHFEIHADDLSQASRFYQRMFGWKFEKAREDLPIENWRIETGGPVGELLKRPAQTPPGGCGIDSFVSSIEVENFDKTAEKIAELRGQITLPKLAVSGVCWQDYFLDPEGNTFSIFQVDEMAK